MIDLKERPDIGWNLLFAASLAVIALGGALMVWKPPVKAAPVAAFAPLRDAQHATEQAEKARSEALTAISVQTNRETPEALGAKTLAEMTSRCDRYHLQLSGFRSEKPLDVASLREVPFILSVDGDYVDVTSFLKSIESPKSKLAASLLQLTISDVLAGHVKATVSLVAFLDAETP